MSLLGVIIIHCNILFTEFKNYLTMINNTLHDNYKHSNASQTATIIFFNLYKVEPNYNILLHSNLTSDYLQSFFCWELKFGQFWHHKLMYYDCETVLILKIKGERKEIIPSTKILVSTRMKRRKSAWKGCYHLIKELTFCCDFLRIYMYLYWPQGWGQRTMCNLYYLKYMVSRKKIDCKFISRKLVVNLLIVN